MKNDTELSVMKLSKKSRMIDNTLYFNKSVLDSVVTYRHSVGELRHGSIDRRYTVNFVGSAHLPPKQEKACCRLSQQAFSAFYSATAQ